MFYIGALWTIVIFLASVGLVAVTDWVLPIVSEPRRRVRCYCILPIEGHVDCIEELLRWGYNSMRWDRWIRGGRFIIVDMGADQETLDICKAYCRRREDMILCSQHELAALLTDDQVYKTLRGVLY
jgi:hypothetical protein